MLPATVASATGAPSWSITLPYKTTSSSLKSASASFICSPLVFNGGGGVDAVGATCPAGALVWAGESGLRGLFSETVRSGKDCGATSDSATVGTGVSAGFFPSQTTSTINTAQMPMNQKIERLIFIGHQLPMLKPNCAENSNVCQ